MQTEIQPSTFLAAASKPKQDCFCLLGVPLDVTVSFRPGTKNRGWKRQLASWVLEEFSLYQERDLKECIADLGDLALPAGGSNALLAPSRPPSDLAQNKQVPFILGGEHLLTLPAVGLDRSPRFRSTVLQFDAMPICGPNMRAKYCPMPQLCVNWQKWCHRGTSTNLGFARHRRRSVLCSQHTSSLQVLEPVAAVRSSLGMAGVCKY